MIIPQNRTRTACAEKHDKLGWAAGFSLQLGEQTLGIRCNDAEFIERLRGYLPAWLPDIEPQQAVDHLVSFRLGGAGKRKGTRHFHLVYDGWTKMGRTENLEEALACFSETVLNLALDLGRDRVTLLLPARCLKDADGGATLMFWPEARGEQRAQAAADGQLLSSSFVGLDPLGTVLPCPLRRELPAGAGPTEFPHELRLNHFLVAQSTPGLSRGQAVLFALGRLSAYRQVPLTMSLLAQSLKQASIGLAPEPLAAAS